MHQIYEFVLAIVNVSRCITDDPMMKFGGGPGAAQLGPLRTFIPTHYQLRIHTLQLPGFGGITGSDY